MNLRELSKWYQDEATMLKCLDLAHDAGFEDGVHGRGFDPNPKYNDFEKQSYSDGFGEGQRAAAEVL